jgi:predicted phosphodiesterase
VEWVRDNATWIVQGNHDRANADGLPPRCHPEFAWLSEAVVPLTRAQLDTDDKAFLRGLPRWAVRDIDGVRVACFHAKPSDPLYGYLPPDPVAWAREVDELEADLILVGHTHVPMDLRIGYRRVVNPGSVGQPKHGDSRAAFAILEDGEPRLCRISYPVEEVTRALAASTIDRAAVDVLSEMLRTGQPPRDRKEPLVSPVG